MRRILENFSCSSSLDNQLSCRSKVTQTSSPPIHSFPTPPFQSAGCLRWGGGGGGSCKIFKRLTRSIFFFYRKKKVRICTLILPRIFFFLNCLCVFRNNISSPSPFPACYSCLRKLIAAYYVVYNTPKASRTCKNK